MFKQYREIKKDYPDALLFYRMGDFYELFFEDAVTASKELQITLTKRGKTPGSDVVMCGVPWHSAQTYLAQLLDKGYSVAICDQIEDPREAKGLVQRAVTRVITPGTILDDANLNVKEHNWLGALFSSPDCEHPALAWVDISTGQWSGTEFRRQEDLWQWVHKLGLRELILPEKLPQQNSSGQSHLDGIRLVCLGKAAFNLDASINKLLKIQKVQELAALGLEGKDNLTRALGALLYYLEQTQKCSPGHLLPFRPLDLGKRLIIDEVTQKNLEILTRLNGKKGKGTLRHLLDMTLTPMGGRLLEDMLRHPWREATPIKNIQEAVSFLLVDDPRRSRLRTALAKVGDLERLSTKICLGRAVPNDFVSLRQSLEALPLVREALLFPPDGSYPTENEGLGQNLPTSMRSLLSVWDDLADLSSFLGQALLDQQPAQPNSGGMIRIGFNTRLDHLLDLVEHSEQKLLDLLENERISSELPKLKLGYNKVFGYYYELSKASLPTQIPKHFIPRQTLSNCDRFTTEALKNLEQELFSASEERNQLEYQIFCDLRAHVAKQRDRVMHIAGLIAQLDYWQCLAETGRKYHWIFPELVEEPVLELSEARHPVLEEILGSAEFVPNGLCLDQEHRLCLLTGPNMAGKSTILRQSALICIMAQMGAPVPAAKARIGLVDRLFSRVGASDDPAKGQSTFMLEMMETARILRQTTRRSLIILDEIGRGTSTYDGLAIAWAVVEDLVTRLGGERRTLFATHYHELTALEGILKGVFTMNTAIREHNGEIVFLHRLLPGPADRSYGIEVARLAGVPAPIVQRALAILTQLEDKRDPAPQKLMQKTVSLPGLASLEKEAQVETKDNSQNMSIRGRENEIIPAAQSILDLLTKIAPERMTPLEALETLTKWKKMLCEREEDNDCLKRTKKGAKARGGISGRDGAI